MIKPFWTKWSFLFKLRFIFGVILLIFLLLFLYLKIVPFGQISYSRDYSSTWRSGKGFISGFTPAERVDLETSEVPAIIGDPVYFSVFTPRTFDQAKMTIVYRDNLTIDLPIIEAGVLVDNIVWRYDLKPVDNKALDYLMLRWDKLEENGLLFLQKEKNYSSLADWEKDLAKGKIKDCSNVSTNCLAVYNYTPPYKYQVANYQPLLPLTIDQPLRGAHQFYLYLKDEPLHLDFSFIDQNLDLKPAPIKIILSSENGIIDTQTVDDPNLNPGSGQMEEKKVTIDKRNLPAGIYKVEVKITDDMIIKKISSSIGRLSFIHKIWPVSGQGNLKVYTDSNYLQVKALSPASLQTISFGGNKFSLTEAYRQFDFYSEDGGLIKEIKIAQDDLILENNGVFALSPNALINPSLMKVDRFFSVKMPVKYIVAEYQKPKEVNGFKVATVEFDLQNAYREKGKYNFMIAVPGLKADDKLNDNLEIYKINIEFEGRTLWQKIWQ